MSEPPNVLFLVADSLRYDTIFGDWDTETPNIDRVAEDGITFTNCFSQGISTAPAMTAMLTGRLPLDYGGHWYLNEDQPTMAEQFRTCGYTTGGIHSNPNVSGVRNFDRGFDTFNANILPVASDTLPEVLPETATKYLHKFARILRKTPYLPADVVNEQIVDWVEATAEPWFLWTQYMDTHGPYLPGNECTYRNKFRAERLWQKAAVNAPEEITADEHDELRQNYQLEVEYLDNAVGRFLDRLEGDGHLAETIIVLVGDHGDEFGEHGQYGHGNLPYEELVHVPLVIRFPDGYLDRYLTNDPQQEVTTPVRCIDILPTILDAIDASVTAAMNARLVGESLLPVIEGAAPSYDIVVTEKEMRHEDRLRFGFRDERFTFLYDGTNDQFTLFDRDTDPAEQRDVSAEYPDTVERFQEYLSDRLTSIEKTSSGIQTPELDDQPGVQERLQALGYRE